MDIPSLSQSMLHLIWPQVCAHCRQDLPLEPCQPLCGDCQPQLAANEPPFCQRCAEPTPVGRPHCLRCAQRLFACSRVRSAFLYKGPLVSLVHAFKFRGRRDAARMAGIWMGEMLPRLGELGRPDVLVPMPLHPRRRRERGFNQALLIAQGLMPFAGAPVEDVLCRVRETRPLWALARQARQQSLAGAIDCGFPSRVEGRHVWVIDDVCTSGASLEACAEALLAAGARSVQGYVLARQAQPLIN